VETIHLLGMPIAAISLTGLLEHIGRSASLGEGGWVVTTNLDMLLHFRRDRRARGAYLAASVRVADGMPLVWASHLQGSPLPERVAGSTLTESLIAQAAKSGLRTLLLGGFPGSAERAAQLWQARFPQLQIVADSSCMFSSPPSDEQVAVAVALAKSQSSQIVLVGLGSPKQELLIERMRVQLPSTWFVGVGGTFRFLTGEVPRAPAFLQTVGMEWLHRLAQEPRRLSRRYLLDDLPVFFLLMADAAQQRIARRVPWLRRG
jgi:N-acetylglucosaminyldiphosphoundecaprenol N-acetyl-beta-D-mannosaminyltransferase